MESFINGDWKWKWKWIWFESIKKHQLLGKIRIISLKSSSNPCSKIRSASSITKACKLSNANPLVCCHRTQPMQSHQMIDKSTSCQLQSIQFTHLQMIEQTARCSHQDINTLYKFISFHLSIGTTNHQSMSLMMMLSQLFQYTIDLNAQFTHGRDDDSSSACIKVMKCEPPSNHQRHSSIDDKQTFALLKIDIGQQLHNGN